MAAVTATDLILPVSLSSSRRYLSREGRPNLHLANSTVAATLTVTISTLQTRPSKQTNPLQAWCVECDCELDNLRLKLFFMDLQSVPRNHIRYISWIAYVVKRDSKSGQTRESLAVRNSPHSNYYLQDGIDMGTIMDTNILAREVSKPTEATWPNCLLLSKLNPPSLRNRAARFKPLATTGCKPLRAGTCWLGRPHAHTPTRLSQFGARRCRLTLCSSALIRV